MYTVERSESARCIHLIRVRSILFSLLLWSARISARLDIETAKAIYSVESVQGGSANLPCDITPPEPGDKMHILIWYKDRAPIYTFDSRDKKLEQGKHWADEVVLGGRAYFRYQEEPAKLTLDNVKESDGGIYHCRVDFRRSPTRNVVVNLTVIIPPAELYILNERGARIPHYILGPYNEGSSINITCVATGGRPSPKVTWWQENALIDDSYEYFSEKRVRNVLHLDHLQRKHLYSVFTCQASNNNLVTPISNSITIDMNLKPLWVRLLGTNKPMSAEMTYEISCEVVGSRPTPTVTWWKGSVQLTDTRETTSPDSNTTTSVVTLVPSFDDAGKYLSCRGQQALIAGSALEDGWKLEIFYVPIVTLELGSNLDANAIREGVDVYFECNIKSNPWVYKVSWKHNGKMLYSNVTAGTIISNQSLVLQSVNKDRAGNYTCLGTNHEGDGESNVVLLDVKLKPLWVRLLGTNKPMSAEMTYEISCEIVGSRPTPTVTWWKGSVQLTDTRETTSPDSNTTTSVVTLVPSFDDAGKYLSCRGQQALIAGSALEDGWKLEIFYVPIVTLELGSNLDANAIREGVDVYFECNIKSNPWVYKVSWKHNGKMLYSNVTAGTIISNQSLVLQSVNKDRAGNYTCLGTNHEGDGESNVVLLDVKFAPVCSENQQKIYYVARQETTSVACEVAANPPDLQFSWKFNNSDNSALMLDMPQNIISVNRTKSRLLYTPMMEQDYGTLLCRAGNSVGQQQDFCVFYIYPAAKPDAPSNCSIANQTSNSIQVQCDEGFNGGLPQLFVLEIYDVILNKLISNLTATTANFVVGELNPGRTFEVFLYAVNRKGPSDLITFQANTLTFAEKQITSMRPFIHLTPLLGVLMAVVISLILVASVIVIIIRFRRKTASDKDYGNNSTSTSGNGFVVDSKDTSEEPLRTDLNISVNSLEEKNPDIIPLSNTEDDYLEEERAFERLNISQPRSYIRMQNSNEIDKELPNQNTHFYYSQHAVPCLQTFPLSQSSVPRLHPPQMFPSFIPRIPRERQHSYGGSITSATPLIPCEENVPHPILVPRRSPSISTQSQIVTRF